MLSYLALMLSLAFAAPEMIPVQAVNPIGATAPTFSAPLLEGGEFNLEDHRGKTVVLSFWASWCGPCRQELPALAELQVERDDIEIFAVNVDRDASLAQRFLAQTPFDLPIVWDNESMALGQYDVTSMPTMFVIDANGTLKFRKTGYSKENGLRELIAALEELK